MPCLIPPWTSCRATKSAVEPVEQLLLTLMIGIPDSPSPWYIARCPQVESPVGKKHITKQNVRFNIIIGVFD